MKFPIFLAPLLLCTCLITNEAFAVEGEAVKQLQEPELAMLKAFESALKREDIDSLLKLMKTPFLHDGKKIVETTEEVSAYFSRQFEEKDFSTLKIKVQKVLKFKEVRPKASGETGELLKSIALDTDLVVILDVSIGSKNDTVLLLVRSRETDAKLIGFRTS